MKRLKEKMRWWMFHQRRTELVTEAVAYFTQGGLIYESDNPRFVRMYSGLSPRRQRSDFRQLEVLIRGQLFVEGAGLFSVRATLEGNEVCVTGYKMPRVQPAPPRSRTPR